MSIKPILFNTEMVRAILDGRKTVTRRLIKFPVNKYTEKVLKQENIRVYGNTIHAKEIHFLEEPHYCYTVRPKFLIGEILYVRETWGYQIRNGGRFFCYKADNENETNYDVDKNGSYPTEKVKWNPSIHMPKEAARIWLKVFNVRVERLQDISNKEAEREGIICETDNSGMMHRHLFSELWNSTIKKSDIENSRWYANPWVWVIEFERCEKQREE